ncbi:MAG: hypothetical protein JXB14_02460 [Candidatus Altiarchaeota archaeon]|nr:hypothetical protein [Candidatus Altiarchaeota archaeon]
MTTSIQVEESTVEMLKTLKSETKAKSYDQIIVKLVGERHRGKSMFGFLKGVEDLTKDLRDETDRI